MGGHIMWWRWLEHFLAIAGLAWLANWFIELFSQLVGRQWETAKLKREIQDILKEMWGRELAAAQMAISPEMASSLKQASSEALPAQWKEEDSLKRQIALARWGAVVAWRLSKSAKHMELLTEVYTRAAASGIQSSSGFTLQEVRRIAESAAHRQPRPDEFNKGLLYDLGAAYFYTCRMYADHLAAAAIVPMLLEEHLKTPALSAEELLATWQIRVQHELDVFDPLP